MSSKRKVASALAGAVFAALAASSSVAHADGLLARAAELPATERTKLQQAVAEQRRTDPASFAAIRELQGIRREHYGERRNPIPEVGRELKHLGKKALLPMLEALVLEAPPTKGMTEEERTALVDGLLFAVGHLRDARSAAPLQAIFAGNQSSAVLRGAGRAMGRLCDASSLDRLKAGLKESSRRLASIDGLGECRSLEGAKALAAELDQARSKEEAATIARALGNLGSSWAWQALGAARQAEGEQARDVVGAALVRGFARFEGETRAAHRAALGMAQPPSLRRIVDAARPTVDAAVARELDRVLAESESRR